MKILHFLPFFSPHAKGGTEIFLLNLARSQIENGHEVQIICPNTKEEAAFDHIEGIRITYFPFPYGETDNGFLSGIDAHRTSAAFCQIVAGIDPDVIHLHGLYPHFLKYFEALQRVTKHKLILTVHLVNILCPNQTLVNWRNEYCEGKVDFAICSTCVSSAEGSSTLGRLASSLTIPINGRLYRMFGLAACANQIPAQRRVLSEIRLLNFLRDNAWIDVLNPWFYAVFALNGFSTQRLSYFPSPFFEANRFVPDSPSLDEGAKVKFLFVGRLSVHKGVDLLIQALQLLGQFKHRFSVSFVGKHTDPELIQRIQRLADCGFAMTLAGEIENEAMALHYRDADYLLFPSLRGSGDMLPMVIQEAFQNDLAVVSSDIPAAKSLVKDGVNGYLFGADDKYDLCRVIRKIIETPRTLNFKYRAQLDGGSDKYHYYEAIYQRNSSRVHLS